MSIRTRKNFVFEEDYPVIETSAGKLRGFVDDGVFCFRGVEYACAKRFHLPEPPVQWEGVKDAVSYGYTCPEMSYRLYKDLDHDLVFPRRNGHIDEQCQNLNIWTKSINSNAKRPVMVWLHGGGYATGSSINTYSNDGWEMAANYDVVIVTVNHRLNLLGFLDLSDFGEEYAASGNLSIADMIAALQWVKSNITAFGGDPDNVTIFGQSGGGGKVMCLLQSPKADGLFHKAILQSGGATQGPMTSGDNPSSAILAKDIVEELGLNGETIHEIETMDLEKLQAAARTVYRKYGMNAYMQWSPKPDGKYYLGFPGQVGFRKETAKIPLIVGSCLSEFGPDLRGKKSCWTDQMRRQAVASRFGENVDAAAVLEAFKSAYPELDSAYAACVDLKRPQIQQFIDLRIAMADAPVYNYVFAFETLLYGGMLPGHGGDLHFMFHNALYLEGMRRKDVTERLQDEMAGAWAQFAHTGNPNGALLPHWTAYNPVCKDCMVFGSNSSVRQRHDEKLMELLKEIKEPMVMPKDPVAI